MQEYNTILEIINPHLQKFENELHNLIENEEPQIRTLISYYLNSNGKRIRPSLVYLSCKLFSEPNQSTHLAAVLVELIHTATLLHDDVIDESILRRGKDSMNKKWGDKISILTGDYLFALSMKLTAEKSEYKLFDIITPAILSMSLIELQQLNEKNNFIIDEKKYFEIISNKTANLLATCCKAGLYTSGIKNLPYMTYIESIGKLIGLIFQIKDDIFDYTGTAKIGKEVLNDIKMRKITLPLIYAYNNMNSSTKKQLKKLWLKSDEQYNEAICYLVLQNGGIQPCNQKINELQKEILQLFNHFPDSKVKTTFISLIELIVESE